MEKCLEKALHDLYNKKVDPLREPDPTLFEGFRKTFDHAVDVSVNGGKQSDLAHALKSSNEVFSVFRAHRMGRDMAAQMVDKEGNLKSFDQFRKDVEKIADHHIRQWLRTEYDMAVSRAHLAADWATYEKDQDIMPNLRWVESTAITPEATHRSFWGMVRPVDDAFWAAHHPGDHWGCQCSLEQTDDPVTPLTEAQERKAPKPSPGLEENPGKTKRIFSDRSPYFPGSCQTCPLRHLLPAPRTEKNCYSCPATAKAGEAAKKDEKWTIAPTTAGRVRISSRHGKNEVKENTEIATVLANRHEHEIDLIEKAQTGKSADTYNHTLQCKQEYKRNTTPTESAVDFAIRKAAHQANDIVLDIDSDIPSGTLANTIQKRVARSQNIRTVWVIRGAFDKQYTREEILADGFKIQWD